MTGYAVREAIRDVLGHFWSESFGQIYPTLRSLEEEGYVTRQGAERTGASVFHITPEGERRLASLLQEPIQDVKPRNGLLLRLFFGRHLGPEACRELIVEAKEHSLANLDQFAAIRREVENEEGSEADRTYMLLTLSAGEHGARALVDWAEESLAILEGVGE